MRVLVCGSRTFSDRQFIWDVLRSQKIHGVDVVIEGGAAGADLSAARWALANEVEHQRYEAEWHQRGKSAGVIRNQRMLDEGKPDVVFAFVDKPLTESKGTADMVRRALAAGIRTYVIVAATSNGETTA